MTNRRGFTLVELLVSMILVGIVGLAAYQLLVKNQQLYRQQAERTDLNANMRAAVIMLPSELREINATDTVESDITAMTASSITYKAMRTTNFLCQPPDTSAGTITLWRLPQYGWRSPWVSRDSLLIFAEGDMSTRRDNFWVHANLLGLTYESACPNGQLSMTMTVGNVYPPGALAAVTTGAPVRAFEMNQVLTYADARGDNWLGMRQYNKGSGWTTTQPFLGPLARGGVRFVYYDTAGATTNFPAQVARIEITVPGMTQQPVRQGGTLARLVDTLATQVAVRNNRR
ncbi:MAG: prepilin-type N-terminal cleavage/methylation domain-containing protein [Gemmatimonadales bacterium]|jgi:prepilin-type N-terminal cleavage/methylation domain-containing protein